MKTNNLLLISVLLFITVVTSATVMAANKKASQSNEKEANSILRVSCDGEDVGAEVQLNGKFRGECPVDITLSEGTYKLRVFKAVDEEHERIFEQEVRIGEGNIKKVEAVLIARLTALGQKREDESRAVEERRLESEQATKRAEEEKRKKETALKQIKFEVALGIEMVEINISGIYFEIGKFEVTQGQWKAVMGSNPSKFSSCGDTCPVERVSWNDAQAFINKLNSQTGKTYHLPTRGQWDLACHAGSLQQYCGNDNIDTVAWYDRNASRTTHPVGQKQANAWGIYDMSGNVLEWLDDCNNGYAGECSLAGGSVAYDSGLSRAAMGYHYEPTYNSADIGFRLVRTFR